MKHASEGIHPGIEIQGQTSSEIQNKSISDPTKTTDILQNLLKTTLKYTIHCSKIVLPSINISVPAVVILILLLISSFLVRNVNCECPQISERKGEFPVFIRT